MGSPPTFGVKGSIKIGGGDPILAYGANGEIYAGAEVGTPPDDPKTPQADSESVANVNLAVSTDGGKTFSAQQSAGTPIDRPWITVDLSTGMVYTVSSGALDVAAGIHNKPGPTAPNDRWLVAWQPLLKRKSEPRRLGGSDFSASGGSTFTAAHGVVAATFVLGGPAPGQGNAGIPAAPMPVPASLQGIVRDGTTSCSLQAPCLFFETSKDQGKTWTRHHVPVPGGFDGQRTNVSADPGRAGRYAIAVLTPSRTNLQVMMTDDSGATWTGPFAVPETGNNVDFKVWMAYGPTGVLGLVWKDQRDDLPQPQPVMGANGRPIAVAPGFDVYSTVSCDGGKTWNPAVRMNAETSPPGPAGHDDITYMVLDDKNAHMVWGDRRALTKVTNVPGGGGGIQTYYGRLPFSVASHGAACGRK
jgi:hypothetical protein